MHSAKILHRWLRCNVSNVGTTFWKALVQHCIPLTLSDSLWTVFKANDQKQYSKTSDSRSQALFFFFKPRAYATHNAPWPQNVIRDVKRETKHKLYIPLFHRQANCLLYHSWTVTLFFFWPQCTVRICDSFMQFHAVSCSCGLLISMEDKDILLLHRITKDDEVIQTLDIKMV